MRENCERMRLRALVLAGTMVAPWVASCASVPTGSAVDGPRVAARPAGPVELTELEVRELDGGALLELSADASLVWTQYRDDQGSLVVELPNTSVGAAIERHPQTTGPLSAVVVESQDSGGRPLTRLRVATTEPIEHALIEDGGTLRLEFYDGASTRMARNELAQPVRPAAAPSPPSAVASPEPTSSEPAHRDPVAARSLAQAGTPEAPVEFVPGSGFIADRLEGVELVEADTPSLRIRGNGEFEYSTFALENPDRFVLDLKGVVNRSSRSAVEIDAGAVERVRLAQFRSEPDPVSRVVIDLRARELPVVTSGTQGLLLSFGGASSEQAGAGAGPPATAPAPGPAIEPARAASRPLEAARIATLEGASTPAPELAVEAEDDAVAAPEPQVAEVAAPPAGGAGAVSDGSASAAVPASERRDEIEVAELVPPSATTEIAGSPARVVVAEPVSPAEWPLDGAADGAEDQPVAPSQPESARPRIVLREPLEEEPLRIEVKGSDQRPRIDDPSDVSLFEAQDVRIEPQTQEPEEESEEPAFGVRNLSTEREFFGEPVSLSLKDADITEVLRTFAREFGLNIVIQPGVGGPVTVELNEVPWDQALDSILKVNGLGMDLEGSILRIAPVARLQQEAENEQRLAQARALAVPLTTIMKRVSYASANDISRILTSGLQSGGFGVSGIGGFQTGILSQRGSVSVDGRTNTLIIRELPEYLDTVIQIIENLDTPTEQVMIEARIIETTRNFSRTLGIDWSFSGLASAATGNTTGLQFPNNINTDGGVQLLTGGANGFLNLGLGNVLNTFQLDVALQAAEADGLINVISAPKISTLDNVGADIQTGLQIPIQTVANNTVSVQFVNATLRLSVTPQVTAEGTIQMDIQIQKREPQLAFAVVGATNAPIATREARTRVIVRDGGTAVIGGIYTVSSNQNVDKVPGLANIPVLGHLFKNRNRSNQNEELLIFITPRVIQL